MIENNCQPPYIDAEILRAKAEETWPQWKIDWYNEHMATSAHARKLQANDKKATEPCLIEEWRFTRYEAPDIEDELNLAMMERISKIFNQVRSDKP